jgi:hypothetical protein
MTFYYTTAGSCYTGTCSNYYNDLNSTTASNMDYRNWDYLSQTNSTTASNMDYRNWGYLSQTGTISTEAITMPYGQTYRGAGYVVRYLERQEEVFHKPTEQELSRQREEKIKAEETARKAKADAEEAARKARLLLIEHLDQENIKRLINKEPLEIPSRLFGDIKYHIPISNSRIKAQKDNKVVTELCLIVKESGQLPIDDIILTKLLHILHDEENVLRTANHFNTHENLLTRLN